MSTIRWIWVPVLMALTACDPSAADLTGTDEGNVDQELATVVKAEWNHLSSMAEIQERIEGAVADPFVDSEVHSLLSMADGLRAGGGEGTSLELSRDTEDAVQEYLAQAAMLVFGPELARATVRGAAQVLGQLDAVAGSSPTSVRARAALGRASFHVARASAALDEGDGAVALRHGAAAAEAMRELAEDELAARWIRRAERLHARASTMAGPNPEPPIPSWLDAAHQMLQQAHSAFDGRNYQAAISHARSSAQKSWQVISALREGPDRPTAEELAERAIQIATNLLSRASEMAGSDPGPRVARALEEARDRLDQAEAAFNDGDFRATVRWARASGHLSLRVIHYLSGDGGGSRE